MWELRPLFPKGGAGKSLTRPRGRHPYFLRLC